MGLKSYFLAMRCGCSCHTEAEGTRQANHEHSYWFIDVPEKLWWLSESAAGLVRAPSSRTLLSSLFVFQLCWWEWVLAGQPPPEWEERCRRRALASQRFSVSQRTDEWTQATRCTKPRLWFACWSWAGPGPSRGSLSSQNRSTRRRRTSKLSR